MSMLEHVPVVAGAARGLKPAVELSRRALQQLRLFGTFPIRWLELDGHQGLTAADVEDLEEFLGQRQTRALLSVLALTMLTPHSDVREESLETVRDFFMNAAQHWWSSRSSRWYDRRTAVWDALARVYDQATPAGQELGDAASEYEDFLHTPLGRAVQLDDAGPTPARYVERLAELGADLTRVVDALSTTARIKSSLASAPAPPIITYRSMDRAATFGDLYVSRTLVNKATDERVGGLQLGERGAPYRAVVHGAPGAGKSTFVRNLLQELNGDPGSQPALLLTARNYFPGAKHLSVVEYLHGDLGASSSLDVPLQGLHDALTLGLMVVIFDGLDEITDITQRVEMVRRISMFAAEFPATPILVTSRSIGYDRAPLPDTVFDTLTLDEYTPEQSSEYIQKWFAYIERPDLAPHFQSESESVADLRKNPLLLSLLCILYRERGSIPIRRRDIYGDCADLLFHKWDSHRHIGQPEELHKNGDRIMQEIARWVYNSQAAQNGLSESVITKTIGQYLRDATGVEDGEARRRAGEFLEFCAERAWLLGATGTDHGERVFAFTHRTFFEYFTAEALARTSMDPAQIAKILVDAHNRDATTVLPELLLQAVDDKVDRGAANTFKVVCDLTHDEVLIMQLMEGVPLPATARARGFDRILELWWQRREVSRAAFQALLTLHSDARDQFIRDYLVGGNALARSLFMGAWVSLDLLDQNGDHFEPWNAAVTLLAVEHRPRNDAWYEGAIAAWRWRRGATEMPASKAVMLTADGASGKCPGTLWFGLELAAEAKGQSLGEDLEALFKNAVLQARSRLAPLEPLTSRQFAELALRRVEVFGLPNGRALNGDALWAYLYATGMIYETTQGSEETQERLIEELPILARDLWQHRTACEKTGKRPSPPKSIEYVPRWLRDWAAGRHSFTYYG